MTMISKMNVMYNYVIFWWDQASLTISTTYTVITHHLEHNGAKLGIIKYRSEEIKNLI